MKGNFSRLRRPDAPVEFSSVLLQQGRVLLDSDWNDLVEIVERELQRRTSMIVGEAGTPADSAGFGIDFACAIDLNSGGPQDGQFGQAVTLRRRPSLPFREDSADRPYSLLLHFSLPSGCCGESPRAVLLSIPGRFSVQVEPDLCLVVVGHDEHERPWARLGRVEPDKRHGLHVNWDGRSRLRCWIVSPPTGTPLLGEELDEDARAGALTAPTRTALSIAGGHRGDRHLRCAFAGLWIWNAEREPGAPVERQATSENCQLVCALDPSAVQRHRDSQDAVVSDASGSGNEGWIRTLEAEQRFPPVRLLDVEIGAGHYLVAGLDAHNPEPARFTGQPWLHPELPRPALPDESAYFFYLEVWQRFVSALEYPQLAEVALGGPDTTARTELVWQVDAIAAPTLSEAERRFRAREARQARVGRARFHRPRVDPGRAGNRLYRVEVHHPGWALQDGIRDETSSPIRVERASSATIHVEDPEISSLLRADAPVALGKSGEEPFVTHVRAVLGAGRFELSRLPERLAHELRLQPVSTFKWSRDNGAVAFPVRSVARQHATTEPHASAWIFSLESFGYNGLDIEVGDYLELIDDARELARIGGLFVQVREIDPAELTITVESARAVAAMDLGQRPVLRRWDRSRDRHATAPPLQPVLGSQLLEHGIHVEFAGDGFYAGAAWWVVAVRDEVGDGLLWPQQRFLPPQGIALYAAPLATLEVGGGLSRARDLRAHFASLTELSQRGRSRESTRPDAASLLDKLLNQAWAGRACFLVEGVGELPGLERTGVRVEGRSVRAESWQNVDAAEAPRGPGVAVLWQQRPVFVGEAPCRLDERGSWQPLTPFDRRVDFAACACGSRLWLFGGRDPAARDAKPISVIKVLDDPGASEWRELSEVGLSPPSVGLAAVELGGRIHLLGGAGVEGAQKSHRIFDPRTHSFSVAADMLSARKNFAAVAHEGLLYAIGGADSNDGYLSTVECWDPASDTWRMLPPLDEGAGPGPSADLAAASVRDGIVVAGGFDGTTKSEAWLFLPALRRWQALAPLSTARARHGLLATSNWREPDRPALYAVGGTDQRRTLAQIEVLHLTRSFEIMRPVRGQ